MSTESRTEHGYRPFPNDDGKNSRQAQLEIPMLVRAMKLPADARILEIGCGRGIALPVFDRLCGPRRLVGLDIDGELLMEAADNLREHGARAELCCGDVRRMPFEDGSFEVVIDFGTLYHIARSPAALDEIARVLAPGWCLRLRDEGLAVPLPPGPLPRPSPPGAGDAWSAPPPLGDAVGLAHEGRCGATDVYGMSCSRPVGMWFAKKTNQMSAVTMPIMTEAGRATSSGPRRQPPRSPTRRR